MHKIITIVLLTLFFTSSSPAGTYKSIAKQEKKFRAYVFKQNLYQRVSFRKTTKATKWLYIEDRKIISYFNDVRQLLGIGN